MRAPGDVRQIEYLPKVAVAIRMTRGYVIRILDASPASFRILLSFAQAV